MKKILIVFLITIAAINALKTCAEDENCNNLKATQGTEAYFFSPHGLGRTPEVPWALDKIKGQVKVRKTSSNFSSINYILDNVTLDMVYNYNNQQTTIPEVELVQVTGGRVEFTYKFNYTKIENRNNITGYAYGSVLSDPITYYKDFNFCGGFLCWRLAPGKSVGKVTIDKNRMTIKRMDPYNSTDLTNIQDILDNTTIQIDPSSFKTQILQVFNQLFPLALNDSLNHEVFGQTINYTYYSNTHGQMKMNIVHQLWKVQITPEIGYKVIFVTKIDGWEEDICNITVPNYPASYSSYGGSQTYHLNCLYESVVRYMHANGWLDTDLNKEWDVDAFQFYAGDLFDLINNLYLSFDPKEILDGKCLAQKDGLSFVSSRQFDGNVYNLAVDYKCSLKGSNKNGTTTQIMKFTARTKFYIVAAAAAKTLTFKIKAVDINDLSFEPIGSYYVSNMDLAMWKANRIFQKIANTYTFGTDFPTVTRQSPKTRVDKDWVFYYDNSHLDSKEGFEYETEI